MTDFKWPDETLHIKWSGSVPVPQIGEHVKTYINNIRIEEAQRLLANTKLNISEIAYTVGFNSPSTFNKVFKKTTGMTPSETK